MGCVQPDSEVHIYWKGAAEIVLGCCTAYLDESDNVVKMDQEKVKVALFIFIGFI